MSILKKLAGETALYGLPTIVGRMLYFLLVRLHTGVFSPEESGIQVTLFTCVAFLQVIYTFGMETSFFRFASRDNFKTYYNVTFSAVLTVTLLCTFFFVVLATPLAIAMDYPGSEAYIRIMALVVAIDGLVAIPFARLRLERRPRRFALVRMVNIILNIFFNVFFLIFCKDIYEGKYLTFLQPAVGWIYFPSFKIGYVFLANLLANLVLLPILWDLFRDFRFHISKALLQPVLIYGYPILIMGLAGTINTMFDRITLRWLLPEGFYPGRSAEAALGIYGNCYKLAILMNVVIQAFRYAAEPFFFSQSTDKNAPATFALVMKWFIIACCLLWVGISINLDWLAPVFLRQAEYLEGLAVVPYLLLGNLFLGVYYNLTVWFKLTDKTQYGTWLTFLGAGVNIVLNLLLIPFIGYMGCAVAFLLSCGAMMVACYLLGQKYFPVPYNLRSAGGYLLSAGVLVVAARLISFSEPWLSLLFPLMLTALYAGGIIYLEKIPIQRLPFLKKLR